MSNPATPVTPVTTATPGSNEPNQKPASTTTPPGAAPEDKVSISTAEYRQLQRDNARLKSIQRRESKAPAAAPLDPLDPATEEVQKANARAVAAEAKAAQYAVKNGVRDLLDKPEFKGLPESLKRMVTKNPAALSTATDPDEVLLDVEDYLREEMVDVRLNPTRTDTAKPPERDTPPVPAGGPAPATTTQEIDVTHLTGSERSTAILKNQLRKVQPGAN